MENNKHTATKSMFKYFNQFQVLCEPLERAKKVIIIIIKKNNSNKFYQGKSKVLSTHLSAMFG